MINMKLEPKSICRILPCEDYPRGLDLEVEKVCGSVSDDESLVMFTDGTHAKVKHLKEGTWEVIAPATYKDWIAKQYPDGKIDWKFEYERLMGAIEQTVPFLEKKGTTATNILLTAFKCGNELLSVVN